MAKFTKLNIGDAVASSGGRVWKKLSSMLQLAAPTLSLDGNMLTITDDSGLATSFDILADGEVKYTYAKYLYNGVELPPIPNLQGKYFLISTNKGGTKFLLHASSNIIFYQDYNGSPCMNSNTPMSIYSCLAEGADGWELTGTEQSAFRYMYNLTWSNHDIPNGSATATAVYFKGTDPVLSGTSLTSATVALSTFGLSEGTHSITAIAKAGGYIDSAESEAVSFVEDELAGTWVFKETFNIPDGTAVDYDVDFVCNGVNCSELQFNYGTRMYYMGYWSGSTQTAKRVVYDSQWTDYDTYKTINITSKLSEVTNGSTILTWLKANATKQ